MKTIKVFYHGTRLKDIYPYATKTQIIKYKIMRFIRKVAIVMLITIIAGSIAYGSYVAGFTFNPQTTEAAPITIEVPVEIIAPVMDRIADCESGKRTKNGKGIKGTASHYDEKGQVLIKPVMTGIYAGTYDVGYYQINSNHNAEASQMGLDLTKEKDNKIYAQFLYKNVGTQPWYSSASCWM